MDQPRRTPSIKQRPRLPAPFPRDIRGGRVVGVVSERKPQLRRGCSAAQGWTPSPPIRPHFCPPRRPHLEQFAAEELRVNWDRAHAHDKLAASLDPSHEKARCGAASLRRRTPQARRAQVWRILGLRTRDGKDLRWFGYGTPFSGPGRGKYSSACERQTLAPARLMVDCNR